MRGPHSDPDLCPAIDWLRDSFGTIWEINDLSLRAKLVRESWGMSYLDRRYLASRPDLAQLQTVTSLPYSRFKLTFELFHRRQKELSMAARRFIDVSRVLPFDEDRRSRRAGPVGGSAD